MTYFCYQGNDGDCGFAALKMLLARLQKSRAYLDLEKPKGRKEGFSLHELVSIAKEHGVILNSYRYTRKFDVITADELPFLACLEKNGSVHVVMVSSFRSARLSIYDPAEGIIRITFDEFLSLWNGYTLEPIAVEKRKYKRPRKAVLPWIYKALSYGFDLIALTALLVGFSYLNVPEKVIWPIVALSVFALVELGEKWYLFKVLKYFDRKYMERLCSEKNTDFKKRYQEYLAFKKGYFAGDKHFVMSFLMAGLIVLILCLNDVRNLYFILFFAMIVLFEHLLFKDQEQRKQKAMSLEESLLLGEEKTEEERLAHLDRLNGLSYRYAFDLSLRKFVYLILLLGASLLLTFTLGIHSANFVLLNFFIYYFFIENLQNLAGYGARREEYRRLRARFLDAYL